jgi:hypothetical protein
MNQETYAERLFESWEEVRPPIHRILKVKAKRVLSQKSINRNFLTGDFFRGLADFSVVESNGTLKFLGSSNLESAKIIFCESSVLQDFLHQYQEKLSCTVIMAGNSDYDFERPLEKCPPSLRHLFLQNSSLPNSDLVTGIPIGIENARYAVNGHSRFMKNSVPWSRKKMRLLVGPFGLTHKERLNAVRALASSNEFDFASGRLSPAEYSLLAANYRYIACPRGNGIDTHRFWETLYRGSLPVVIDNAWSLNMCSLGVPMVRTATWAPVDVSLALQNSKIEDFDPKMIPAIWPAFWTERIRREVC